MSVTVSRVTNLEDLQPYRETWNELARVTAGAQFFQSFDWFECYWRHYGGGQQMEVLLVLDGSKLLGIVPLVIRTENRRVGSVRVLTFPLDDWGSFFSPVTPHPDATMAAAIDHLARQPKRWDILSWRWLAPHSPASQAIADSMRANRMKLFRSTRCTTAVIDLPQTCEEYHASRSGKFRNNWKRWRRRVEATGEMRYEKFRPRHDPTATSDPRWDLYDACEEIASRSWQGSSSTGTTLSHASVRPFLRDVHRAAAALGAVDLNLLYLDDQPVAFEYGYWWQGYKTSLRFGYDQSASKSGIGNLLWIEAIQASIDAGDHTFDMGPGSLEYKTQYLTRTCDCETLDYFRPLAPKAQLIALKQVLGSVRKP
ncbi:GNAT family N-acetyltransferase [Candidatus Laterigemmans baculatus]|uniref:GNAT family N-acetyltransferase n=1 Tax=Candidatus Laterigemmans baculatus TaxID=2770505 RepID=UPI0013DC288C|nr:GNAT family N-acetyltransferase [Candidatus Laterigemmans baculatus]